MHKPQHFNRKQEFTDLRGFQFPEKNNLDCAFLEGTFYTFWPFHVSNPHKRPDFNVRGNNFSLLIFDKVWILLPLSLFGRTMSLCVWQALSFARSGNEFISLVYLKSDVVSVDSQWMSHTLGAKQLKKMCSFHNISAKLTIWFNIFDPFCCASTENLLWMIDIEYESSGLEKQ